MIGKIISRYRMGVLSGRTVSDWDVDFRKAFEKEIMDYEEALVPDVWYAAYGSNLNSARFQRYFERCDGDIKCVESRPYTICGTIYFAEDSSTWGRGKGVTFYDETEKGIVLAKVYKVSRNQFKQIQRMEGPKYARKLLLGVIDDVPVYTFTSPQKQEDINAPSFDYVQTILEGLKETYPDISENVLISYLFKFGAISDDAYRVLAYIRRAPHSASIKEMTDNRVCSGITRIRESVRFLSRMGLIKLDSRNAKAGHRNGDPDAMYFTVPEKRDITDLIVCGVV